MESQRLEKKRGISALFLTREFRDTRSFLATHCLCSACASSTDWFGMRVNGPLAPGIGALGTHWEERAA